MSIEELQKEITGFAEKRNWKQFHTPKNLAMALTVETAELLEIFQWMTPEQSYRVDDKTHDHIEEEIGDVMIYLTTIAASFNIDPVTAARKKMNLNADKYPIED